MYLQIDSMFDNKLIQCVCQMIFPIIDTLFVNFKQILPKIGIFCLKFLTVQACILISINNVKFLSWATLLMLNWLTFQDAITTKRAIVMAQFNKSLMEYLVANHSILLHQILLLNESQQLFSQNIYF